MICPLADAFTTSEASRGLAHSRVHKHFLYPTSCFHSMAHTHFSVLSLSPNILQKASSSPQRPSLLLLPQPLPGCESNSTSPTQSLNSWRRHSGTFPSDFTTNMYAAALLSHKGRSLFGRLSPCAFGGLSSAVISSSLAAQGGGRENMHRRR